MIALTPELSMTNTGIRQIFVRADHCDALVGYEHHTEIMLAGGLSLKIEGSAEQVAAALEGESWAREQVMLLSEMASLLERARDGKLVDAEYRQISDVLARVAYIEQQP